LLPQTRQPAVDTSLAGNPAQQDCVHPRSLRLPLFQPIAACKPCELVDSGNSDPICRNSDSPKTHAVGQPHDVARPHGGQLIGKRVATAAGHQPSPGPIRADDAIKLDLNMAPEQKWYWPLPAAN